MEGLTDVLRIEMRGTGIDVILIEPGPDHHRASAQNAIPHFERWIDWRASPRRAQYEATLLKRLYEQRGAGPVRTAALGRHRQADPRAGRPAPRRRATS